MRHLFNYACKGIFILLLSNINDTISCAIYLFMALLDLHLY